MMTGEVTVFLMPRRARPGRQLGLHDDLVRPRGPFDSSDAMGGDVGVQA